MLGQRANCPQMLNHTTRKSRPRAGANFVQIPISTARSDLPLCQPEWHRTSTVYDGRPNLVTVAGLSIGVAGVVLELGS